MKISELLNPDKIIPKMKNTIKKEVINELIDLFKDDERVLDLEAVRSIVLEREKIMSTGVGKGFAIPHGKTNSVKETIVAFGKTREPIDFEALDDQPVRLIFMLVGKEDMVAAHIKLLSRISRMMNEDSFRENLLNANSAEEIHNYFVEEEKKF